MIKSLNQMTNAELTTFINQTERLIRDARIELTKRPYTDVPFYGFVNPLGQFVGYDDYNVACDEIVKQFPQCDPERLRYSVDTYYKTAEEVYNAQTQKG